MPVSIKHLYQRLNVLFPTDADVDAVIARLKAKRQLPSALVATSFTWVRMTSFIGKCVGRMRLI
jgi:hypothetical protein